MLKGFMTASGLLPERLWRAAYSLSDSQRVMCEEFRLRLGRPFLANVSGKPTTLTDSNEQLLVTKEDIDDLLARVTGSSLHTYNNQLASGFITAQNGHRLGICGNAVVENAEIVTLRAYSSVNLRIAKQAVGLADFALGLGWQQGLNSALVLGAPGAGKTTLLRDMARSLSYSRNVSLADERCELAAVKDGLPQFDVGRCDVLSACGKRQALDYLLRGMSPGIIVMDEITSPHDAGILAEAAYSGCDFLAGAHGSDILDLTRRPAYRQIMDLDLFTSIIVVSNSGDGRKYTFWQAGGEIDAEDTGNSHDSGVVLGHRVFHEQKTAGSRHNA